MTNKRLRKGFTLVEMIFVIILMTIIFQALASRNKTAKVIDNTRKEIFFFQKMEDGIKANFITIIEHFEVCSSKIVSDSSIDWGWRNGSSNKTSPFPTFDKDKRVLTYNIQSNSIESEKRASFQQAVVSNMKGACTLDEVKADTITLYCPRLVDFTYKYKGATVSNPHTLGEEIDPEYPPIGVVTYDKNQDFHIVPEPTQPYVEFSMEDIYTVERKRSEGKMNFVRNAVKKYYNTKQLAEFANSPSDGLNSMDDEIVFWMWQGLSDDKSKIHDICERDASTGECSNFDSSRWRTSVDGKGMIWNKISKNILDEDTRYSVDGFNNQVIYYPITSSCATSDYATCSVVVPTKPKDEYTTANVTAPYVSVMFTRGKGKKSTSMPNYVRAFISF